MYKLQHRNIVQNKIMIWLFYGSKPIFYESKPSSYKLANTNDVLKCRYFKDASWIYSKMCSGKKVIRYLHKSTLYHCQRLSVVAMRHAVGNVYLQLTTDSKWSMSRRRDILSRRGRGRRKRGGEKRLDEPNNTMSHVAKSSVENRANRRKCNEQP